MHNNSNRNHLYIEYLLKTHFNEIYSLFKRETVSYIKCGWCEDKGETHITQNWEEVTFVELQDSKIVYGFPCLDCYLELLSKHEIYAVDSCQLDVFKECDGCMKCNTLITKDL